jgi:hypothetical protein
MRPTLILAFLAAPALAQSPDAVLDPETCGVFTAMDTAGRIAVLTTIEPLGDDIDAADQGAAAAWADTVAEACAGHPDRLLSDAAASALAVE